MEEEEEARGEKDSECEVAELRLRVESLKQELKECRVELTKLQKQLSHSERLQKSTESYNEDLRKQVSYSICTKVFTPLNFFHILSQTSADFIGVLCDAQIQTSAEL